MQEKPTINLIKIIIPLLVYSVLLYFSFQHLDKQSVTPTSLILVIISSALLFYIVNMRLIYIGNRKGVIVLLFIMIMGIIGKIYLVFKITPVSTLISGYGLLLSGFIFTTIVFILRHLRLRIVEAVTLYTDKETYILGEAVNYCIEINPKSPIMIDKLSLSLIMSENSLNEKNHVEDLIVYEDKHILVKNIIYNKADKINRDFVIPQNKMSSTYGQYNSIFWYLNLEISAKNIPLTLTRLIEVKPEILVRTKELL